ncbi:hypothetical protein ACFFMM_06865 [Micromonospora chaiyaphumensis]|uniref:PT repeat-containing protein n=1 Tax=Micromonospora chaiyaphumensis TaxID=307119 RepID=A0A1C4VLU0_9ACTN|nr:hypothetical protein [Micromonospora chaiyaphumensis]SCE84994.1 hypothetical protein GA0070214_102524 [Micromonospora chaiyaphumensis]
MLNRRARWGLALATGCAALFVTAACGGSDDGAAGDGTPGAGDPAGGFAAYASCLKEQGIDLPDNLPTGRPSGQPRPDGSGRPFPSGTPSPGFSGRPGGGRGGPGGGMDRFRPDGVDDAAWQKAQDACRSALPTGGPGGNRGPGQNGGQGTNTAYANCLADRGVQLTAGQNTSDAKVAEALTACKALSPAPSPAAS